MSLPTSHFFWACADVNRYKIFLPDVSVRGKTLEVSLMLCAGKSIGPEFYLKVRVHDQTVRQRRKPFGDFPELSGTVAMSDRAIAALGDLIAKDAELLPLAGEGEGWQVLNITTELDALDPIRAKYKVMPDTGAIYGVDQDHIVLRRSMIEGHHIFRVVGPVYFFVSERFVERYTKHRLEGLRFIKEIEVSD